MSDANSILEGLERAIELELAGQKFYRECADKTEDETGMQMFNFLADAEEEHESLLQEEYEKHSGSQYNVGDDLEEFGTKKVFSEEVTGGKADGNADDLDAINIGINAEMESIELYKSLKNGTDDAKLEDLFETILEQEEKHLSLLENQIEFIVDTGEWQDFGTITS